MKKKQARSRPMVRFDSNGCVVVLDTKLSKAIKKRLMAQLPITVRVAGTLSASASTVELVPPPRPPLYICPNAMCDCPVDPLEQVMLLPAQAQQQSAVTRKSTGKRQPAGGKK